MTQIKGNKTVLIIMVFVIIVLSLFAWAAIQNKRTEKLHESAAYSVLTTSDSQSPYTDISGNPILLTDYFGDVLVVSSWASWCPDCALNLSLLSDLALTFEDRKVQVLAINRSEPATIAERFLRTVNATSGVLLVLDPDDRFYKSIDGYAMPETVIYDAVGNIVYHAHGTISAEDMNKYVTEALAVVESDN